MPLKTKEVLKPHKDATERRDLRNERSKTWQMPDGKLRCEVRVGTLAHYRDDDGSLRTCDTTIQQDTGNVFVEWLPYKFKLHDKGIGFDFQSRESGRCSVTLAGIGGKPFDGKQKLNPIIEGDKITFSEVVPGLDIVFRVLPSRVKSWRFIHNENAPRTFEWLCEHDKDGREKISDKLIGNDASGGQLELVSNVVPIDASSFQFIETWTGKVKVRDKKTRIKSLSDAVYYPVEIDPTVSEEISNTSNDITDRNGSPYDYYLHLGRYGASFDVGLRWAGITVPNSATINSATLSINVAGGYGGNYATGTVLGHDADNAGTWSNGSVMPSTVPVTSATIAFARPTTTGVKTVNVAPQIQEIVNRAGWVSGNAMSLVLRSTPGDYFLTFFEDYVDGGAHPATLSIDYTSGGSPADTTSMFQMF